MTIERPRKGKSDPLNKLDSKKCADRVRDATALASRLLKHYGEPTMSLNELRTALGKELQDVLLSEVILKEREHGR